MSVTEMFRQQPHSFRLADNSPTPSSSAPTTPFMGLEMRKFHPQRTIWALRTV